MDELYNDIRVFASERKAARSRGNSLPRKVTATMRDNLEHFLNKEVKNVLYRVAGALEAAFSTTIDRILGTALSNPVKVDSENLCLNYISPTHRRSLLLNGLVVPLRTISQF